MPGKPMYATYVNEIDQDGLLFDSEERTSDVQLSPAMNVLLLAVWLVVCAVGFGVAFLGKYRVAGTLIVAAPTFIGMLMKPTFALCVLMLVLPTGAGVGLGAGFSLDRAIGLAVAVSFLINVVLTRPGLRVRHNALWVAAGLSAWIFCASLLQPYLSMEITRAFTQLQLVILILVVYWILETNYEGTFVWALRSYVIGMVGSTVLAFRTGAAIRAMHETRDTRYAATLGSAIDANMLAALTALAFLSAIYLFARDRSWLWRVFYLAALLFLPVMMLKIGSRGGLVALAFTLVSPLLFVRQVIRRPALAVLLLLGILLASASGGLLMRQQSLDASVANRLTDVQRAKQALDVRMAPIKNAVEAVAVRPAGTGYFSWFERTGSLIWPHNDFFFALGVYGIPGAILFAAFVILLMLTVKRMPLTLEKLYARAVLTFLLVMGLSIKQVSAKYFWVFLAFVLATERLSWWHVEEDDDSIDEADEEAADVDG
ncbi:MAG: hypothetical protein JW993_18885 [Sedimentisphaerales bacterium]|nr:hypothetical protein [Sedimentisphaerales bacterium]